MPVIDAKTLQQYSFWLSIFIHLLLFLSFTVVFTFPFQGQAPPQKKPALYIPSYTYHENNSVAARSQQAQNKRQTSPAGVEKPQPVANNTAGGNQPKAKASSVNTQAVHLIGDKKVDNQLIVILGKAITARLVYPRIAEDFDVKGVAYVGFLLHTDGRVSEAAVVQSSGAGVLDEAALQAINKMTPKNVGQYLKEPKYLIFGVRFM